MAELNLSQATTTNFTGAVPDYIVKSKTLDAITPNQEESYWYFSDATKNYGYYFNIAEIYNAANALCTWAFSRGYKVDDPLMKAQLEHIRGAGNSSFNKIMWQHGVVKLIVGDAFIEVKRNEKDVILNMIPVSPERVRVVFTKSGLIKRYDIWTGSEWKPVKKENMLHSSNKQIAAST